MKTRAMMTSACLIVACLLTPLAIAETPQRWSRAQAWQWYNSQPWPCGFNYVPANAISYTEMWMDYCFDPKRIDTELKLAQEVGFNCLRVVFSFVVWEHDPQAFKQRFEQFLQICHQRGLKVMPIFFDDCVFGPIQDPVYGRQPEVVEGWYANGWTPSPGHGMVRDQSTWPRLERFVSDIINAHKTDPRILCWDLYNEPANARLGEISITLTERVFACARQINPIQPLTVGCYNGIRKLNQVIMENSDIITFHNYSPGYSLLNQIKVLKSQGRPMICTEWLNRGRNSIVTTCLPVFFHENVGCLHWGLVNGKTQTDLNWGHQPGDPEPAVWQHDLYHSDYTPYCDAEIQQFKFYLQAAKSKQRSGNQPIPVIDTLLPTSELISQSWRYTIEEPKDNWMAPDFDDSQWQTGPGAFGGNNPPNLHVATEWNTNEIWLRKEFQLDSTQFADLQFRLYHDEELWIYINGKLALHRTDWSPHYIDRPVPAEKLGLFHKGHNTIAVKCRQTSGGQGVDVGLFDIRTTGSIQ